MIVRRTIMSATKDSRIKEVVDFWFGKPSDSDYLQPKSFWYGSKTDDIVVEKHLGGLYGDAKEDILDKWKDSLDGSLALIVLLDQVPRNIFRDKPEAYATDEKALNIAKHVLENGWDEDQPATIRRYLYSPFNHSENLKDQEKSLELFTKLGDHYHLHWARSFHDTIKTHGRFPHRDRILNR